MKVDGLDVGYALLVAAGAMITPWLALAVAGAYILTLWAITYFGPGEDAPKAEQ